MLTTSYKISGDAAETDAQTMQRVVFEESKSLLKRLNDAYANNLKLTLVRVRKVATGDTLRSVRADTVLESPSRQLLVGNVSASRSIIFIQMGRAPGKKAPMRFVGDVNGRKVFEPLPQMVKWFTTLNIPRAMWNWICILIGRRGIKPTEVQKRALNASKDAFKDAFDNFGVNVTRRMFRPNPGE